MYRWRAIWIALPLIALLAAPPAPQAATDRELRAVLGAFPDPPALDLRVLSTVRLEGGQQREIEYTVEPASPRFDRPVDRVRAYLFVPDHDHGQKLPAIVAIHQDGPNTHLGKSEPAGLAGDEDQRYGLELFRRGYVVICPDRYYHASRRRIPDPEHAGSDMMRDMGLWLKWAGQLILDGRTHFGKEAYDLMRAVDVLCSMPEVDTTRIGAIGHSAGGNVLVNFMFVDQRVAAGVSSCGFYDLVDKFDDRDPSFANSVLALPGLARVGRSADYLAGIAPRAVLLTRGLHERGDEALDREQVRRTLAIEAHARPAYARAGADRALEVRCFNGGHAFPESVRVAAYAWLGEHLARRATN